MNPFQRVIGCILIAALAFPISAVFAQNPAQPAGPNNPSQTSSAPGAKELVAVLEFVAVGASKEQTSAVTDRVEDALLKAGIYDLVDRTLKKKILSEQAFQEEVCTTPGCAVQAGRLLGAKRIVAGRLTKIDDTTWLVSAQLLDVETGKTVKAETIPHKGDYFSLLKETTVKLAARLSGTTPPPPAVPLSTTPPQSQATSQAPVAVAATQEPQQQDQSIAGPVMTITGLALGAFFTAMAQALKSGDSGSGTSSGSDPGVQILTTFSYISFAVGIVGIALWVHESNQKSATADADASGWIVGSPMGFQPAGSLALQVGYRYAW